MAEARPHYNEGTSKKEASAEQGPKQEPAMTWNPLPTNGRRYLVKIRVGDRVEVRTAEFIAGMWSVDGCDMSVTVLEFAEIPETKDKDGVDKH